MNRISLIAALGAHTRALGKDGNLLWHIPSDLKRFKELTTGHSVIMGRRTWESLPEKFRPLPGRTNIIVTRQVDYKAVGATVTHSFSEAKEMALATPGNEEVFVIGGGQLYGEALPFADRLYLTLVDDLKGGDTYFPAYAELFAKIISDESCQGDPPHHFQVLERK